MPCPDYCDFTGCGICTINFRDPEIVGGMSAFVLVKMLHAIAMMEQYSSMVITPTSNATIKCNGKISIQGAIVQDGFDTLHANIVYVRFLLTVWMDKNKSSDSVESTEYIRRTISSLNEAKDVSIVRLLLQSLSDELNE